MLFSDDSSQLYRDPAILNTDSVGYGAVTFCAGRIPGSHIAYIFPLGKLR